MVSSCGACLWSLMAMADASQLCGRVKLEVAFPSSLGKVSCPWSAGLLGDESGGGLWRSM